MKKTIKIVSLLLAAVLMLTCFAGCKKDGSLGTINGNEIPTELFKLALSDMIQNVEATYGVSFDEVADQQLTEQMTVYQYVVSYSVSVVQQALAVNEYFDELGLEWNEDMQAEYDTIMQDYFESFGGEDATKSDLKDRGIEFSAVEDLMEFNTKYTAITNYLYGAQGTKALTDDEIIAKFHNDYARIKHILVATVDTETYQALEGEALATAEAKYADVEAKVKALAVNDEAGFTAIMKEYNEDPGMEQSPDGYVVTDNGQFVQAFVDGAFSVEVGEYAFVDSEEYGHHILMRLPTREEDIKAQFGTVETYLENARSTLVSEDLSEKIADDKVDVNDDALVEIVSSLIK